jgi:tetratricopeptide (TPR) repeat protein
MSSVKAKLAKNADANVKKGNESLASAKKAGSTSLFKWSPDWEEAAHHFRQAVQCFALSSPTLHLQALLDSLGPHEKIGDHFTCGKHCEAAGKVYEEELQDASHAHELYVRASTFYRLNDQPDKAAATLLKAASVIAPVDADRCMATATDSIAIFKDEGRGTFANEHFKKCVSLAIEIGRLEDAKTMLREQNKVYLTLLDTFENDVYKGMLSILVILFHQTRYEEAGEELDQAGMLARFSLSDEATAAESLMYAYRQGSAELLKETTSKTVFQYLPNKIARMAAKLKFTRDVLEGKHKAGQDFLDAADSEEEEIDLS